jgi:hypothetical protein
MRFYTAGDSVTSIPDEVEQARDKVEKLLAGSGLLRSLGYGRRDGVWHVSVLLADEVDGVPIEVNVVGPIRAQ